MVGVHMKMATTKQTGRYSGGPHSSPMMDYISGHPSGRFLPVAISLMGTVVKVQTKENKHYEGVFRAFSPDFDIALEVAHHLELGREDNLPRRSNVSDKMIFKLEDIVKIEGTPDLESVVRGGFATDAEISRANNGSFEVARDLEPWEPDAGGEDDHFVSETNGPLSDGWSVEEMFSVNQERFSIQSDYDEKLYHTAELNLDPNNAAHQEAARRAHEIACEIERNPASKKAADLENDDEERDIVVKSSGSSANNSAATTPTSATASGAANRYVPPNKRPGGDRSNRGVRRGGGSGAQYQPAIRNPGGGDGRGPARGPPRDYSDANAHPLSTSYYAQRPANRFPQQQHHHQIVAQTSHERSPTGPGVTNEWERARGPKRQDIRETHGAAPFPLPPQLVPVPQSTRPMPMIPARPTMEGTAPNGSRRSKMEGIEELKKFGRDFQLTSDPQARGIAGPPAVTTAASSSNQSSRIPSQSSPTQSQLPPPPMSIPPPQPQQRRSPDLKNQPASSYTMGGHQTGPLPHHPPRHHHHPSQSQSKQGAQISPGQAQPSSLPPPTIRPEVPPRILSATEAMYQQQQVQQPPPHVAAAVLSQQHPAPDYSNPLHVHQQPQRPNHPSMMVMQGGQSGNGGPPLAPKMQPIPGHMPPQLQPMVISQPPPPPTLSQPPPAQTPQQQQLVPQQPSQPQHEQEQRSNESATETIKKSKLNPEAAEFRPQFRSTSAAPPPPMVPVAPNPAIGNYPMPIQSPPQTPIMQQTPMSSNVVYSCVSAGGPVANPALYAGAAQGAYPQQHPHSSTPMSVQIVPGGAPLYTIPVQASQPAAVTIIPNNAGFRPRAAVAAPPQQAVAAATGQPIMTSPYAQQAPYLLYNPAIHQATQPHPGVPAAGAAYPQNPAYVVNANRMLTPQYVLPQAPATSEHSQQQFYAAVSPVVQVPPGSYPQAASVPSAMHQSAPGPQYNQQQQSNGNNNHSQTPPTSQQQSQPTNPTSAPPPPPSNVGNVSGTSSVNAAPVIPYPSSAPTPQSPQYPTGPGGPGAYPCVFFQPNYVAAAAAAASTPQLYSNQGGMAPGAVHIQNAAAVHHGYPGAQTHFMTPDYAQQFATIAAAQQAAVVQQQISHAAANSYHPAMLRSSATSFVPGGPVGSAASGQGAVSISHQSNHS